MSYSKKFMGLFFKKADKLFYKNYKLSSHAKEYEQIAQELNCPAQHVYEIAHGAQLKSYDDHVIWDRLMQEGIVGRC